MRNENKIRKKREREREGENQGDRQKKRGQMKQREEIKSVSNEQRKETGKRTREI